MKAYKLKHLPIKPEDTRAYTDTELQQRIRDLETVINLLHMHFTEGEAATLPDAAKELFEEVDPETLLQ